MAATSIPNINTPIMPTQKMATSTKTIKQATLSPILSETEKALRGHTIRDITKTVIIITLLFAAQAGIYFAQSQGLLAGILQ